MDPLGYKVKTWAKSKDNKHIDSIAYDIHNGQYDKREEERAHYITPIIHDDSHKHAIT